MKHAIIDIGSNSIRLTLYEITSESFKLLFREKIMAGLAGYVENGALSAEGIECACTGLLKFQNILKTLEIKNVSVFSTAALRNISNSKEALSAIRNATGYFVEILGGEEEALLGYTGAMREFELESGIFFDIGGASTEIVDFNDGKPLNLESFPVGALSLYHRCVKRILPGEDSLRRLMFTIKETVDIHEKPSIHKDMIVGIGGTARAALKFSKYYCKLADDCCSITAMQLDALSSFLCSGKKSALNLILRLEPERIHTLIPGILIMQHIVKVFHAKEIIIGKYGVREGYLCQRIIRKNTATLKTEN